MTSSTPTLEERIIKVIERKGKRGIRCKKIWEDRTITESWEQVEDVLTRFLAQGKLVVSNKRFWLKP